MTSKFTAVLAFAIAAAIAAPAFAAGMTGGSMMAGGSMMMAGPAASTLTLKPGQTLTVAPGGELMIMPTPPGRISVDMMQGAAPVGKCMILTMGSDHKLSMATDSKLPTGMMACDELSKMQH